MSVQLEPVMATYGLNVNGAPRPLRPGTEAQVWQVDTEKGPVLLRTLKDREQGEKEWAIFRHLRAAGFTQTPAILPAPDGNPMVRSGGAWYQLQEYRGGTMPDPGRPGVVARAVETVRQMEAALSTFPGGRVIHGDLGPWNLLKTGDRELLVLDFGEGRRGDPYFDYAALLGGFLNHAREDGRDRVWAEFRAAYGELDLNRLREQLTLWAQEGIVRWSPRAHEPNGANFLEKFHFILRWTEENLDPKRGGAK